MNLLPELRIEEDWTKLWVITFGKYSDLNRNTLMHNDLHNC